MSAEDFALDPLWRDWSPGYAGTTDAALATDCLREPASLAAAIGYYPGNARPSPAPAAVRG